MDLSNRNLLEQYRLRILFQGDSITHGGRSNNDDWNHVMGHGYAFTITARIGADYPLQEFQFWNRGVSGDRVSGIYNRRQSDIFDLKPDVLSLLAGVNHVGRLIAGDSDETAEKFAWEYSVLLKSVRETLPDTLLVMCEPFILPVGPVKEKWHIWSDEIKKRQAVVRQLSAQFGTIYVPLQHIFDSVSDQPRPEYWIWDGVHPMPAGHELIARAWMQAVFK